MSEHFLHCFRDRPFWRLINSGSSVDRLFPPLKSGWLTSLFTSLREPEHGLWTKAHCSPFLVDGSKLTLQRAGNQARRETDGQSCGAGPGLRPPGGFCSLLVVCKTFLLFPYGKCIPFPRQTLALPSLMLSKALVTISGVHMCAFVFWSLASPSKMEALQKQGTHLSLNQEQRDRTQQQGPLEILKTK